MGKKYVVKYLKRLINQLEEEADQGNSQSEYDLKILLQAIGVFLNREGTNISKKVLDALKGYAEAYAEAVKIIEEERYERLLKAYKLIEKDKENESKLESDDGTDDEEAFESSLFADDAEKVLRDEDFTEFADFEEELEEDDEAFLKSILGG